jgi:hypothetical protein
LDWELGKLLSLKNRSSKTLQSLGYGHHPVYRIGFGLAPVLGGKGAQTSNQEIKVVLERRDGQDLNSEELAVLRGLELKFQFLLSEARNEFFPVEFSSNGRTNAVTASCLLPDCFREPIFLGLMVTFRGKAFEGRSEAPSQKFLSPGILKLLETLQMPVMVHVDFRDLVERFSPNQRQELLIAAYFSGKVRLAIHGVRGADLADPRIKPFLQLSSSRNRNVRVYSSQAEEGAGRTQKEFTKGWTRWVNVGLEKSENPGALSMALGKIKSVKSIIFRYSPSEDKSGLVTKALELSEAALLKDGIPEYVLARLSITQVTGGFTVGSQYLSSLQTAILSDFAVSGAA